MFPDGLRNAKRFNELYSIHENNVLFAIANTGTYVNTLTVIGFDVNTLRYLQASITKAAEHIASLSYVIQIINNNVFGGEQASYNVGSYSSVAGILATLGLDVQAMIVDAGVNFNTLFATYKASLITTLKPALLTAFLEGRIEDINYSNPYVTVYSNNWNYILGVY